MAKGFLSLSAATSHGLDKSPAFSPRPPSQPLFGATAGQSRQMHSGMHAQLETQAD
jgi:hypothetical protein